MFIGHDAVAFASKKFAPEASLGILMAAPNFLDLIWPIYLLLGWERVSIVPGITRFNALSFDYYPYSHSLLMATGWAIFFGLFYWRRTKYARGAIVSGIGVLSHWFFDAVVHRPDLPLYPGGKTFIGLGLWNSITGTIALESALFTIGIWIYLRTTRAVDRIGLIGFWSFVAIVMTIYITSINAIPPNTRTIGLMALSGWLIPV